MGTECSSCYSFGEETKQELNDESENKITQGTASFSDLVSTSNNMPKELGRVPNKEVSQLQIKAIATIRGLTDIFN